MIHGVIRELAFLNQSYFVESTLANRRFASKEEKVEIEIRCGVLVEEATRRHNLTSLKELSVAINAATDGELRQLTNEVESKIGNPPERAEPTDFCSNCTLRPDWWSISSALAKLERGYRRVKPVDPEDGAAEWYYQGEPVICKACNEKSNRELDGFLFGFELVDVEDPEADRYNLEMGLIYFAVSMAEHLFPPSEPKYEHSPDLIGRGE